MTVTTAAQRAAHTRWCRQRRKLLAMGQWQPFVDAEPVREHVRAINQAGLPTIVISEKLGLPQTALEHLMWKRHGVASKQVRRETAEVVMAYWPTLEDFPDGSLIDATGTRRRLEALATLGWTQRSLGARLGVAPKSLGRAIGKTRVTAELARAVLALYDELWKRGPGEEEVGAQAAHRQRLYAVARGFMGPLAWDDDTIDDPHALPITDAPEPVATGGGNLVSRWLMGESVILDRDARRGVLQHLFEWTNDTPEEIADRLDMTPEAADRQWHRIKEKAAADGRRVWRRVYVPRERSLKQNEMEEVA